MKRLSIFIVSFILFLSVSHKIYAAALTQKTYCLDAVICSTGPCSGKGNTGHRVRLTTRADAKLPPNKQAYIIACVAGSGSSLPICTTGNPTSDVTLYGQDNADKMTKAPTAWGYVFEGLFGADGETSPNGPPPAGNPLLPLPVTVKASGEIDTLEWQDKTTDGKSRLWRALFLVDPSEGIGATGAGVKQNDLDFDSAGKECLKISWDPTGRVFDSQTLEPVSGAKVSLMHKNDAGVFELMSYLSSTTKNNGRYELVVPDGTYKLVIDPPYLIATDPATIHPSYSKAYYEVYDGVPIVQAGSIQHRDVAVNVTPHTVTPLDYEYFVETGALGMTISGTVTHPLSIVSVNTVKSTDIKYDEQGREITSPPPPYHRKGIATIAADKEGNFSILVNQASLQRTDGYQEVVYDADVTKVSLTGSPVTKNPSKNILEYVAEFIQSLLPSVYGQTMRANFRIPAMPTYLSGYAYDSSGKPIPNATVGLYLTFSKVPSHVVQADANGFFHVTSTDVPTMPYEIKYTTPTGQVVTTSTSEFIAQNHKTNVANNTNPFEYRDQNNTVVTPAVVKPTTSSGMRSSLRSGTTTGGTGSTKTDAKSGGVFGSNPAVTQTLVVLVLLILLLGGVGVGVLLYMKNKTSQPGTF